MNINHKGGFVQVSPHSITAWSHGTMLGNHYKTVAGAKTAITRHHQQWVEERQNEHMEALRGVWKKSLIMMA